MMKMEETELTEEYWDCECFRNYIHSKTEEQCEVCGASKEDQPLSRIREVIAQGLVLGGKGIEPIS